MTALNIYIHTEWETVGFDSSTVLCHVFIRMCLTSVCTQETGFCFGHSVLYNSHVPIARHYIYRISIDQNNQKTLKSSYLIRCVIRKSTVNLLDWILFWSSISCFLAQQPTHSFSDIRWVNKYSKSGFTCVISYDIMTTKCGLWSFRHTVLGER